MPQIQVLPAIPTYGNRLAAVIGQAGMDIGEGLLQRQQNKRVDLALGTLRDPNKSPIQKVTAFMNLPESVKKSSAPIWASILGPQAQSQAELDQLEEFKRRAAAATQPQAGTQVQPQMAEQAAPLSAPAPAVTAQERGFDANDLTTYPKEALTQMAALSGLPGRLAKEELGRRGEERKERTAKEKEYFKINEPKLIELNDNQRALQTQALRFGRLEELFKDESKFPSATLTAALSKEGQIRPIAGSLLSPEAQEAIKLIQDELSGAKEFFPGRVTNFDVGQYLRRLPSLMNTPEGRQRVLRDLKSINEINQLYNRGVEEVFEEKGGTDKIAFSTAQRLAGKKYEKQIDQINKEFINPDKKNLSELPNPSDPQYLGRKVRNKKTGEIVVSDGKEWKPVSQ